MNCASSGPFLLPRGLAHLGFASLILDFAKFALTLSLQSLAFLDLFLPVSGCSRLGLPSLVFDSVNTDSTVFLHSLSHSNLLMFLFDLAYFGSFSSTQSPACAESPASVIGIS